MATMSHNLTEAELRHAAEVVTSILQGHATCFANANASPLEKLNLRRRVLGERDVPALPPQLLQVVTDITSQPLLAPLQNVIESTPHSIDAIMFYIRQLLVEQGELHKVLLGPFGLKNLGKWWW